MQELDEAGSRPVWGAWIEIRSSRRRLWPACRRAPYGARGLKCLYQGTNSLGFASRPVWGAWIEILAPVSVFRPALSRPVWGAWIEITNDGKTITGYNGRAPYGARGLKLLIGGAIGIFGRRAPYGARGLKLGYVGNICSTITSRPVWGAWIEISCFLYWPGFRGVAPRMGRVD